MALLLHEGRKSIANYEMAMFLQRSSKPPPCPSSPVRLRSPLMSPTANRKSSISPASPVTVRITEQNEMGVGLEALVSKYENHRPLEVTCASTLGSHRLSFATSYSNLDSLDGPFFTENMLSNANQLQRGSVCDIPSQGKYLQLGPPPKSFLGRCKYYYDKYRCRNFAPFLLLFLYSIIGAWIFHMFECENEKLLINKETMDVDKLQNDTFYKIFRAFSTQVRPNENKMERTREILNWYEKELLRVRLPNHMDWDMWGAMFFVGALITTIGYGNIAPRTIGGQSFSVIYALIGIPLVLAILSQFGRALTNALSTLWQRYRMPVKKAGSKIWKTKDGKIDEKGSSMSQIEELESGMRGLISFNEDPEELEELEESRTIPVWLALLICIMYICICAGLFCIWETRWNYFTSLYFFFISLSTIGLGDIVPDHPRMLILMFWLVIIGLSIVSMLLSVIQIKMEEWLYNLMIRMQKEYQKALESGDVVDKSEIIEKMMDKQPWFMKNFGPNLINEKQADALERKAEQYDRVMREMNNKNIQTDGPPLTATEAQCEKSLKESMACDPMTSPSQTEYKIGDQATQWSSQPFTSCMEDVHQKGSDPHVVVRANSSSSEDCTSLQTDSISFAVESIAQQTSLAQKVSFAVQTSIRDANDRAVNEERKLYADVCISPLVTPESEDETEYGTPVRDINSIAGQIPSSRSATATMEVQTDIAQFQIDEIVLRLHAVQEQRVRPMLMNRSMETSISLLEMMENEEKGTQYDLHPALMDRGVLTDVMAVISKSAQAEADRRRGVDMETQVYCEKTTETGMMTSCEELVDRSQCTDIPSSTCTGTQAGGGGGGGGGQMDKDTSTTSSLAESPPSGAETERKLSGETQRDILKRDQITLTDSAIVLSRSMETEFGGGGGGGADKFTQGTQCPQAIMNDSACVTDTVAMFSRSMETDDIEIPRETKEIQCTAEMQDEGTDAKGLLHSEHRGTQSDPPDSEDRSMITDIPQLRHRSMETDRLNEASCSAHTQTDEDEQIAGGLNSGTLFYSSNVVMEISTQCSPPDSPLLSPRKLTNLSVQNVPFSPSPSNASLCGSFFGDEDEPKQVTTEVIIQTDDSYLKIARRLDDYRSNNNRNSFLPVCAANPHAPGQQPPDNSTDRPSERRGFYMDITPSRRKSSGRIASRRKMNHLQAIDQEDNSLEPSTSLTSPEKKSRSISPCPAKTRAVLARKASLPPGIPRGRVHDYVALHEKGIPNPATNTRKPVQIIRQNSMCID